MEAFMRFLLEYAPVATAAVVERWNRVLASAFIDFPTLDRVLDMLNDDSDWKIINLLGLFA